MGALPSLASALLITIAVEAAVGWLMGLRTWRSQGVLLLINAFTNPLLNLFLSALAYCGVYRAASAFDPLVVICECAVMAAETALIRAALDKTWGNSAAISVCANLASWMAGALIHYFLF